MEHDAQGPERFVEIGVLAQDARLICFALENASTHFTGWARADRERLSQIADQLRTAPTWRNRKQSGSRSSEPVLE